MTNKNDNLTQQEGAQVDVVELAGVANEEKIEFLLSLSHDIRTPLNAIMGYTEIALRHKDDYERVNDCLAKIKVAGRDLLDLVNDVIEKSRIESGKLTTSKKPLDMYDALDDVAEMGRALAIPQSIDFVVETCDLANPYVYSDGLSVNEIALNLISNAIKSTPEGGKVAFSAEQLGYAIDGVATYRFTVRDNGAGMTDEFLQVLSETFSGEESLAAAKEGGVGVGLSTVKRLLDNVGGTISVQSVLGEGSTFVAELPMRVMDDEEIAEFRLSHAGTVENLEFAESLVGKHVLLVEDNEMNRDIATEILEDAGLEVTSAENGEVAVRRVGGALEGTYDFVLMDIQMPVMDGYEAARAIRELPNGALVPIIALSANAYEEDRKKSFEAGMDAHVAKPIDINELIGTLAKFL